MIKEFLKTLDGIWKSSIDSRRMGREELENQLLNRCLKNLFNGHSSPDSHNFYDYINRCFPVNGTLIKKNPYLETLDDLTGNYGNMIPALIHEYFLDPPSESGRKRKNTGTYYTPEWVVKDMVNQSLGRILEERLRGFKDACARGDCLSFIGQWNDLKNLKVLDPACGWGIFLLEIYDVFESIYKQIGRLAGEIPCRIAGSHFDIGDMFSDSYRRLLDSAECINRIRKRALNPGGEIVAIHIRGIDINPVSAGLARTLLAIRSGIRLPHDFKSLESIIQADFIQYILTAHEKFDLVTGNPPYFSIGGGGRGRKKTEYHEVLKNHSIFKSCFRSQSDISYYFIRGGIHVLKPGGEISFILPSYWMDNEYGDYLRGKISDQCRIREIINFSPFPVFSTARGGRVGVDTMVFNAVKEKSEKFDYSFRVFQGNLCRGISGPRDFLRKIRSGSGGEIELKGSGEKLGAGRWVFVRDSEAESLILKDGRSVFPLGDIPGHLVRGNSLEFKENTDIGMEGICHIGQGQETGLSSVFLVSGEKAILLGLERELLALNIKNRHIKKWIPMKSHDYIIMTRDSHDIDLYPNIKSYLSKHLQLLKSRQRVIRGIRKWYAISIPQNYEIFNQIPKILVPYRARENRFALDESRCFNDGGDVRAVVVKPQWRDRINCKYLLALLNSSTINQWYSRFGKRKGNMNEYFSRPLSRIPVIVPSLKEQEPVVLWVDEIMKLSEVSRQDPGIPALEEKIDLYFKKLYFPERGESF